MKNLHRLFCWIGWHSVRRFAMCDGLSLSGYCTHCGAKCLQDSQGNWFAASAGAPEQEP